MSTQADNHASPAGVAPTQPYLWSLRREMWESRSLWIAPLAAAGFVLFGFAISLARRPHLAGRISQMPASARDAMHLIPYGIAMAAILVTVAVVSVFYCVGALYNERRDRSILFWKSMPVSDATTVLAKASVPLLVLPLIVFCVICATQLVMLLLSSAAALATPPGELLWGPVPLLRIWALLAYGLVTLTLWLAPIYGWLLVISAWARRGPFLWAVLPPFAIAVVEKLAFDTSYFADFVKYRIHGGLEQAFVSLPHHDHNSFEWPVPDPAKYFSTPGLWAGLLAAAALLAVAIWLRRRREPA
jgi:ABC-2 type transport system permease protein